ncbi:MAG TPA: hypothetical protein VEB64_17070 [Azospirillaceae bacterium]|nr:hypothetical protein [Azospirillaceae bacterium]
MTAKKFSVAACLIGSLSLAGCNQTIPKEALQLSAESLQDRQLQTRRFESNDEKNILAASAQVLQDLGFTIEKSATEVGLVLGTKDRDATEAGQVAGAIMMAVVFGVAMPVDNNQKIRASLVTRPLPDGKSTAARVTFQRIVWNTHNQVSKIEGLKDPVLYQEFFNKLSQSVFLTANEI